MNDIEAQTLNSADAESKVQRITTSGNKEFIHIGDHVFRRNEFLEAFGGDLRPGVYRPPSRGFGSPSPWGLFAYALSNFFLGLLTVHTRHILNQTIMVGPAFGFGGVCMLIAGIWEVANGNTFGATTIGSYGGFWISYGLINAPSMGIASSYETQSEFQTAFGLYLFVWFMFTFLATLCTIKSTVALFGLFFTLSLSFLLQAASQVVQTNEALTLAAGWVTLINSGIGIYNAYAGLASPQNSYLLPIVIPMPGADRAAGHMTPE